ncbi:MAG: hypothetical protein PHU04_01275 [Candidatus Peribacteraceae bacterium]|nr:hypothetical protein [Candidatus Peribacteraceae bacterium]
MPPNSTMHCDTIADEIASRLEPAIQYVPDGFFNSFAFTQTGNNLTHPLTWGILARLLWDVPHIAQVGIDVRINQHGIKFQPDLVGYSEDGSMVVFLDYESPNSSDARIPGKDVDAFIAWRDASGADVPYVIITTLPDCPAPDWELRYTSSDFYNSGFGGQGGVLRRNPCLFWYNYYYGEFAKRRMEGITFLNISGKTVRRKYPDTK